MKMTTDIATNSRRALLNSIEVATDDTVELSAAQCDQILSVLDWCVEKLEKQRDNSKIYLAKQKLVNKLIKKHLSPDEMKEIERQAKEAAGQ